jgi:hypothetical protein
MTRTRQAISNFLSNRTADSPFLLSRYTVDLETQVMCDTDGEPGENPGTYTKDGETWGNKRWPYQAGTNPNFSDPILGFSPAAHVDRVGTTWWDYVAKRSVAVGIDIDSVEGHAETTTTNAAEDLEKIVDRLSTLDYVTIVRSTGGKGLHVYVFFDPASLPESNNHHEHTIVARKTLELISTEIGYPLKDHVDCVGSVFWIWAKKSPADHPGFSVVKEGSYLDASRLAAVTLPTPSVVGVRSNNFSTVQLDAEHKRILEAISRQPYYFNIRADMNLIHTHTCAIRDAIRGGLEIMGSFETNSNGGDPQTANCFLAPQRDGVFRVYRFGQSQHEPSWKFVDGKNYCTLNDAPSVEELVSSKSSRFRAGRYELTSEAAAELAVSLGEPSDVPEPDDVFAVLMDGVIVYQSKSGSSTRVNADGVEEKTLCPGYTKTGDLYMKKLTPKVKSRSLNDRLLSRADEMVRCVSKDGAFRGWYLRQCDGTWVEFRNYSEVSCTVSNNFKEFAEKVHELMLVDPWTLDSIPFAPEYPSDLRRVWNKDAPGLAVHPAESGGDHPHFDMILDHIGEDLNVAVSNSEWCRKGAIVTGADYLRCWIACLIHHTDQPLPYLFLSGPQNSGKSVFHECMSFLFSGGVCSASSALTSTFNSELVGCFLAYVEERDLGDKRVGAYAKIKEWVTGRKLDITEKFQTPYSAKNYLHFVQTSNDTTHLPLEDGDTRIVAIDVPSLDNPMPKAVLEARLREEAPRFIRTLLNTVVPPPIDRLRIPALTTDTKEFMERRAMSPLMGFIKDKVYPCIGRKVKMGDLYDAYVKHCGLEGVKASSTFAVNAELTLRSDKVKIGLHKRDAFLVNVSLDPKTLPKDKPIEVKQGIIV